MRKLFEETPPGLLGGGGSGHGQTKGQNLSHLNFFAQVFFGENDEIGALAAKYRKNVIGIILRCSPQREARLRLGSVAAALVNSPH